MSRAWKRKIWNSKLNKNYSKIQQELSKNVTSDRRASRVSGAQHSRYVTVPAVLQTSPLRETTKDGDKKALLCKSDWSGE